MSKKFSAETEVHEMDTRCESHAKVATPLLDTEKVASGNAATFATPPFVAGDDDDDDDDVDEVNPLAGTTLDERLSMKESCERFFVHFFTRKIQRKISPRKYWEKIGIFLGKNFKTRFKKKFR
jgi:hypothetical protein